MICDTCSLKGKPECTFNLRKVESIPDENGIIFIGIKCDDAKKIIDTKYFLITEGQLDKWECDCDMIDGEFGTSPGDNPTLESRKIIQYLRSNCKCGMN